MTSNVGGITGSRPAGPHLWHPFSTMPLAGEQRVVIDHGDGVRVWDDRGDEYLDGMAGLWYCNVGHGREELANVARQQMERLAGFHTFDGMANAPALELAERLCEIAPMPSPTAVFFVSGGSDAVETTAKMARRYWQVRGETSRTRIVARGGAYHGMHAYGTSLAGIESNAAGWGQIIPDTRHVPSDDLGAVEALFDREGSTIAAFIGEPVIGAGGVHPPPPGYWEGVTQLCREHGILLIADEVVCGYGRLGTWFGSERYGIEPDLVTTAKGLSSGYLPIGAVFAGHRILDTLWGEEAMPFRHGYTYSGHPTACAVSIANLDIVEREDLRSAADRGAATLADELALLKTHPLVQEVRHAGLLGAIELDNEILRDHPALAAQAATAARMRGVLTRPLANRSLQLSPAFVASDVELGAMVSGIREGLDDVAEAIL